MFKFNETSEGSDDFSVCQMPYILPENNTRQGTGCASVHAHTFSSTKDLLSVHGSKKFCRFPHVVVVHCSPDFSICCQGTSRQRIKFHRAFSKFQNWPKWEKFVCITSPISNWPERRMAL